MTFYDLEFEISQYPRGIKALATFPNGYSASVIQNELSYGNSKGLYELAVLDHEFELDYTTEITSDVEGYLTKETVTELLQRIEKLDPKQP